VEFAFLFALGTGLGGHGGGQSIAAFTAFPKSLGRGCGAHSVISFILKELAGASGLAKISNIGKGLAVILY
jgi:hypothetical protein